ncbi:hypothetical protein MRX96_018892 [Rhipicephalus microplus]
MSSASSPPWARSPSQTAASSSSKTPSRLQSMHTPHAPGVAQWPNLDLDVQNQCGGYYQSPINIVTRRTTYDNLDVVYYDGYLDPLQSISIVNNGHTVKVSSSKASNVGISGEGLNGWYRFDQLHFHWGSNSSLGSEHRIDGYTYPMEMHLVHMNTKYSTGEEALKHWDGVAVVAVFFQVSSSDNSALSAIVGALRQMRDQSITRLNLTSIPPLRQLMPWNPQLYFRYQGSLTTPPCSEAVTWTVLAQSSKISETQLQAFRNVLVYHGNGSSPEPPRQQFPTRHSLERPPRFHELLIWKCSYSDS